MRQTQESGKLQIVVERTSCGKTGWNWRICDDARDLEKSAKGFQSAEEAYVTAKAHLLRRRANQAYVSSMSVGRVFA